MTIAGLNIFKRNNRDQKNSSVVETTDATAKVGHDKREELNLFSALLRQPEKPDLPLPKNQPTESGESSAMQQLGRPYAGIGQSGHAQKLPKRHYNYTTYTQAATEPKKLSFFARLPLFQKIFISNVVIILGGAIIGSWLTAHLAEVGKFNFVTFSVIIVTAVLFSSAISFAMIKAAFRPFAELHHILAKIHTGNPRARAAFSNITDPDIKQFTFALNHMLERLEENAQVIQEDQRQLQHMTAQVINAQENERKRIARELHDEASQSLTAMIMGLEAARNNAPAENLLLQKQLATLKDLAISTLEELRKLALDLRPTMLDDLGLVPAVRWLSRGASERGNFEVKLELNGFDDQERLVPELETCLFRIVQESLTNITKHAKATKVEIKLEQVSGNGCAPEQVRLTVADNGLGFDRLEVRQKAYKGGHLGLFDIEERAHLLGGKVEILTGSENPCGGTCIIVLVPLQPRPAEIGHGLSTKKPPYTL